MAKPYLGIWLDHREAYLIWLDENGEADVQHAEADYPEEGQKADRAIGGRAGAYGAVAPHAHLEEKQHREAKRFHDKLFRAVRTAERVYIFGPGKAREELAKRLREHKDFTGHIRAVESAEKMTHAQMAARVRSFFGVPHAAV
jgi:hypothetical protein